MYLKNFPFLLAGIIFLVIFISGCSIKEPIIPQADQEMISNLMHKLNSNVLNYQGSYRKEHEFSSWAGHSGATDYDEESVIHITVE